MPKTNRQINIISVGVSSKNQNITSLSSLIEQKCQENDDLIVLPEMCLGLSIISMSDEAIVKICEMAGRKGVYIAFTFFRRGESGKCSTEIFAAGIVKEFDMEITSEDFIGEFPLYAKDFFPGVTELLQELNPKYTLACLSNTNIIQWTGLCERISINKYFQHSFLSYEIGIMKPEREIYTHTIEKLGCSPNEIVFFDDSEANVQAAVKIGMNAHKVLDFNDLKDKMKTLHLL